MSDIPSDGVRHKPLRVFDVIERPRLMDRLERAAAYRVTVVAAPAGYGKTVAVRQFVERIAVPAIRVELGREPAGISGVIQAFGHALAAVVPAATDMLAEAIERFADPQRLRIELVDALTVLLPATDIICVVDGFAAARLEDDLVRELLVQMIERSGEHVRWVIATRATGRLPLASWLAYAVMDAPIGEAELAFTFDEALRVAAASAVPRTPDGIEKLFALTQGWPTAFVLAVRSPELPERLANVAGSNQMIFDYLAEQVFGMLEPREREFVFATCMLPAVDLAVVERLGITDARAIIGRLRKHLPLGAGDSESSFTYQPLFRDFVEYQLRSRGEAVFEAALVAAASALAGLQRHAAALDAYLRARSLDDVERILVDHGFDLLERGDAALVGEAVGFLRQRGGGRTPGVLALRGALEAGMGNSALSRTFFESALTGARDPRERSRVAFRYALELIKRNDRSAVNALERIVPLLEAARAGALLSPEADPALAGTLAIAYSMLDRAVDAAHMINEALTLVSAGEDSELAALIYHQASYIAYVAGDAPRASRMASAAFRIAVEQRNYRLATRSSSIRFSIARGLEDDPQKALEHLAAMHEYAQRSVDPTMQTEALAGMIDIAAERGDEARMREIKTQIEACGPGAESQLTAVPPALALASAWQGDFRSAYDRLAGTDADQPTPLRRGLRLAEIAVYAAASQQREAAAEAAANAVHVARSAPMATLEDRRRFARILAFCALAHLTIGTTATANGLLLELERLRRELPVRTWSVVEAVRALYLRVEIGSDAAVAAALERLRGAQLGGLARLLEALPPNRSAAKSSISLLTPAEIDVLRALARGGSSAKVAVELQRSVNTVNVHVKSIMRKLNCATRYEAIAIAREHGLVS